MHEFTAPPRPPLNPLGVVHLQELHAGSPELAWLSLDARPDRTPVVELLVRLPCRNPAAAGGAAGGAGGAPGEHVLTVSVGYRAAFVGVFDHAPDASRGVDVPPALATLLPPACAGGSGGSDQQAATRSGGSAGAGAQAGVPLLERLRRDCGARQGYSNGGGGGVVPLPIPDFSMPFNVICFTSTLLAVLLGGATNTVLRCACVFGGAGCTRLRGTDAWQAQQAQGRLLRSMCTTVGASSGAGGMPLHPESSSSGLHAVPPQPPPCSLLAEALRSWQAGVQQLLGYPSGSASCGVCWRSWLWRRRWLCT